MCRSASKAKQTLLFGFMTPANKENPETQDDLQPQPLTNENSSSLQIVSANQGTTSSEKALVPRGE